jgi:hypothetical protein
MKLIDLFRRKKSKEIDVDINTLEQGFERFKIDKKYNEQAFFSMINLYCKTNGFYLEDLHLRNKFNKNTFNYEDGLLGSFKKSDYNHINTILNTDGYYKFHNKLNKNTVSNLIDFANKSETIAVGIDNSNYRIYDFNNPISNSYLLSRNDLINNFDIQKLIMDPVFRNIAREYFDSEPIFDFPVLMVSPMFSIHPSDASAQTFHFDLDRVKWLKIFVYLSDVNKENGPHYYIKGSHLPGNKPKELLDRGYSRISDIDMMNFYDDSSLVEVTGEAGSVIVGDTKCWHKGSPVKEGCRYVLQLQYTANLFGGDIKKNIVTNPTEEFSQFVNKNKFFCSNIQLV